MGLRWEHYVNKATNWKCRVTDISASTDRLSCRVGFKSSCSGIQKEALRMLLNICIPLAIGWREDFEFYSLKSFSTFRPSLRAKGRLEWLWLS